MNMNSALLFRSYEFITYYEFIVYEFIDYEFIPMNSSTSEFIYEFLVVKVPDEGHGKRPFRQSRS